MNINQSTRNMLTNMGVGIGVDRAAATLANETIAFFTVTGQIQITALYGIMTVIGGANTGGWQHNPTAGATVSLNVATDFNAAIVGDVLGISGVLGTALTWGGAVVGMMQPIIVNAGDIEWISSAEEGTITTHIRYLPLSLDANVTVA